MSVVPASRLSRDELIALAARPKNNLARLNTGGRQFGGWSQLSITRSIESAASSFQFSATSRFPGQSSPMQIRPGDSAEVWIGSERVITGYIDTLSVDYDHGAHTNSVGGRSKTLDLVDCSAIHEAPFHEGDSATEKTGRWRNVKLETLAATLCAPYGVAVVPEVGTGKPIRRFALEDGETVFSALERAAALRALLLTDDPEGRLVLTRAGTSRARDALVAGEGGNVLSGRHSFDGSVRYSEYRCRGARAGNDNDFGDVLGVERFAEDSWVNRRRVLVIQPERAVDAARCQERVNWEAAQRAGQSVQLGYTVHGWTQGDGSLWEPNALVSVDDPIAGIDAEMLIVECNYTLDISGGTLCQMVVAPVGGYEPLLPPERKVTKGSGIMDDVNQVGTDALRRQQKKVK